MPNILLIDDDPAYITMMESFLKATGWTVATAVNGAEGAAAAGQKPLNVILCDVNLPDIDGVALLADLRAAAGPKVPILLISGNRRQAEDIIKGLDAGSHGYFTKPVDVRLVHAKLQALLAAERP